MIDIPVEFAEERVNADGDEGRNWLAELPSIIERRASAWRVQLSDEPPRHGANALVVFGREAAESVALKVCWPGVPLSVDAWALAAWQGRGAVRLHEFAVDDNAVLLERLDPARSLNSVDIVEAASVIGSLIRKLSIPAPAGFPVSLSAERAAEELREKQATLREHIPATWVHKAIELAQELATDDGRCLVHTDLHAGNVLARSDQAWVAIDPRPSVGHPERSVPDLLLWRSPLDAAPEDVTSVLRAMVDSGGLDEDRARAWTIVSAVGHWSWCIDGNANLAPGESPCTVCDPRCRRLLEALV